MAELESIYFVNAGANGTFADSGKVHTTPQDVDGIFKYLTDHDIEKLLIYFHGGLVSEKSGMAAAEVMKNNFADIAFKRHVVSFVWETGPLETVAQNIKGLTDFADEDFFKEATKFVIKLVAKKLGIADAKGGSGEYLSDDAIAIEKSKINPFEELDKSHGSKGAILDIDNEDEDDSKFYKRLESESKILIENEASEGFKAGMGNNKDGAKGGFLLVVKVVAQIAFEVLKRYYKKTHHDFYPTVMEESFRKIYVNKVGHWGWKQMKKKAEEIFYSNEGLSGDDRHAGTYFLSLLDNHTRIRSEAGKKFDVELIGHSAGSIAICHMLDASKNNSYPSIKYNHVFFLAPACRTDLFLDKGLPAMKNGLFQKFKLFTMAEDNEKIDHCIPYIYTHSLLYLVSGLFEDQVDTKIMGLQEQFSAIGRYSNFKELVDLNTFINLNIYQLVLSSDTTNPDASMRSNALKHGEFDNDTYTLNSILKSI